MNKTRSSMVIFLVICVAAGVAIAASIYWAKTVRIDPMAYATPQASTLPAQELPASEIYFRYNGRGAHFGKLGRVTYDGSTASVSYVDEIACEAVYVAAGRGICLAAQRGVVTTYSAKLFETETHTIRAQLPLAGVPSRTRVSSNGQLGATTVFVSGHGYDSVGFSTQTLLLDLNTGAVIADLESFRVFENGAQISNADFNFWGVTFSPDSSLFYATLSTNGRHLLVRGSIAERRVDVLKENVECPSVSPDGTRVAYKRRFIEGARIAWKLHVLELATMRDIALAEQRSVDDQLEWLDNHRLLYSVPSEASGPPATDVWVAAADGSGVAQIFLSDAYSPSVVR